MSEKENFKKGTRRTKQGEPREASKKKPRTERKTEQYDGKRTLGPSGQGGPPQEF